MKGTGNDPAVSVVMPAFNVERYIGVAIESILSQTLTDLEFIIIDDGSADDTARAVADYQARDNRIQLHRQENCGFALSFNQGCSLAQGRYIAFMGADDISHPRRFERQVDFLNKHPDIGICGTWMYSMEGENKTLFRYSDDSDVAKCMLPFQLSVSTGTVVFPRALHLQTGVRFQRNVAADDYLFIVNLSKHCRISSITEPLYFYRIHSEQMTVRHKDRVDKSAGQVRLMQLEELGVQPSEDELALHEAISSWCLLGDKDVIEKAEAWLIKLKQANARRLIYPEPTFSRVLNNYWFSLCLRHSRFGPWTYQRFSRSTLAQGTKVSLGSRMRLLAKSLARYERSNDRGVAAQDTNTETL